VLVGNATGVAVGVKLGTVGVAEGALPGAGVAPDGTGDGDAGAGLATVGGGVMSETPAAALGLEPLSPQAESNSSQGMTMPVRRIECRRTIPFVPGAQQRAATSAR